MLKDTEYIMEELKNNNTKNILKSVYTSNFKHTIGPQINEIMRKSIANKEKIQESMKNTQSEIEKVKNHRFSCLFLR